MHSIPRGILLLTLALTLYFFWTSPALAQSGWYWTPELGGSGLAVEFAGQEAYAGLYIYENSGNAVWYSTHLVKSGQTYTGPLSRYTGWPLTNGDPTQGATPIEHGTLTLTVDSGNIPTHMSWSMGEADETRPLSPFLTGTQEADATGWWFSRDYPGMGLFTELRGKTLFAAWYHYRADGSPRWWVARAEAADVSVPITVDFLEYAAGQVLGGDYAAPTGPLAVGQATLSLEDGPALAMRFEGTDYAFMGYAFASAHVADNRSLGTNMFQLLDWNTGKPLLDQFKLSRDWISQADGANWGEGGELDLDEDGWVRSLSEGQYADRIFITYFQEDGHVQPFTRYVVNYTGEGELEYFGAELDEAASNPGRHVITLTPASFDYAVLRIARVTPENHIRNISIVPERYETLHMAGARFTPEWLTDISQYRALRFMDWLRTNDNAYKAWSERPRLSDIAWSTASGCPLELIPELANAAQADAWLTIPHEADQTYIENTAALLRDSLDPNLRLYVEHSNEVWNFNYPQFVYSLGQGRARWCGEGSDLADDCPGDVFMQWHGLRTATICDTFKEVFGKAAGRVTCVLGVHPGWYGLEEPALECPLWVAEGNTSCAEHVDAIGITSYFSGNLVGPDPAIEALFADADGGMARGMLQIKDNSVLSVAEEEDDSVAGLANRFNYFKPVAEAWNLDVVAYEGGQHISANGHEHQNDQRYIDFHTGLNRHPQMATRYTEFLSLWKEHGLGLHVGFQDYTVYNLYGSWGLAEYLGQATPPKQTAYRSFNADTPCWWTDCERQVKPDE